MIEMTSIKLHTIVASNATIVYWVICYGHSCVFGSVDSCEEVHKFLKSMCCTHYLITHIRWLHVYICVFFVTDKILFLACEWNSPICKGVKAETRVSFGLQRITRNLEATWSQSKCNFKWDKIWSNETKMSGLNRTWGITNRKKSEFFFSTVTPCLFDVKINRNIWTNNSMHEKDVFVFFYSFEWHVLIYQLINYFVLLLKSSTRSFFWINRIFVIY